MAEIFSMPAPGIAHLLSESADPFPKRLLGDQVCPFLSDFSLECLDQGNQDLGLKLGLLDECVAGRPYASRFVLHIMAAAKVRGVCLCTNGSILAERH